jgi:hypothetical protein
MVFFHRQHCDILKDTSQARSNSNFMEAHQHFPPLSSYQGHIESAYITLLLKHSAPTVTTRLKYSCPSHYTKATCSFAIGCRMEYDTGSRPTISCMWQGGLYQLRHNNLASLGPEVACMLISGRCPPTALGRTGSSPRAKGMMRGGICL